MDISQFAKKPQLHKLVLDDQELLDTYGEEITFWMQDVVDINTYFDFYKHQGARDGDQLMNVLRKIILKEDGQPAINDGDIIPIDITLATLMKVNEHLGKSKARLSEKETGTPQD